MDWLQSFDERERRLIKNCINHAEDDPAGLPGHNLILIIAKMATLLDDASELQQPEVKATTPDGPAANG